MILFKQQVPFPHPPPVVVVELVAVIVLVDEVVVVSVHVDEVPPLRLDRGKCTEKFAKVF